MACSRVKPIYKYCHSLATPRERFARTVQRAKVRGRLAAKYYGDAGRSLYSLSACAVLQLACKLAQDYAPASDARERFCRQEHPMSTINIARASFRLALLISFVVGAWLLGQGLVQGRAASESHGQSDRLPFNDVLPTDWCYSYIADLWSNGDISGYSDNTFRPNATISRGQFTKVLVLATGISTSPPQQASFADIPTGSTFFDYAEAGAAAGFVTGYDCGSPADRAILPTIAISGRGLTSIVGRRRR